MMKRAMFWMTLAAVATLLCAGGAVQAGSVALVGTGSGSLQHNGTTKVDILDPDNNNSVDTAEWGTHPTHVGPPNNNNGYNNTSGEHWGRVFDNNTGSKVCCSFNPGVTSLTMTSAMSAYSVTGYTISTGNDDYGRRPDGWRLFGSTDGFGTSNDLLDTVVRADINGGTGFTANQQVGEVTLGAATDAYSSFRIVFDDTDSPNAFQISEVEVFGTPAPRRHEVGGDNTIGTETLTGTQGNEVTTPGVDGAKYIRVDQNRGGDQLNIAEVQAFETGTGNNVSLAAGNLATQSSTGWGGVASRAIDGNTDGNYGHNSVQHTNNSGYKWWQVELANPTDLDSVHFWGRTDCCQTRQDDFNLVISDASNNELYNVRHTGIGSSPGRNQLIPLESLASADLTAALNPFDAGAGYTYVFELGSNDQITVDNPDPSIFTTILDLNNADIVVEALGPLTPGEMFQLLGADELTGTYHSLSLPPGVYEYGNFNETGAVIVDIPEPITMLAVGLGLTGLGGYIRRRRRA